MRFDRQTASLHYFNAYVVQDRINTSQLAEKHANGIPQLHMSDFLPTAGDYSPLKNTFAILISRVLCQHMHFFKQNFSDVIIHHIPHEYTEEMAKKSIVVSYYYYYNIKYYCYKGPFGSAIKE